MSKGPKVSLLLWSTPIRENVNAVLCEICLASENVILFWTTSQFTHGSFLRFRALSGFPDVSSVCDKIVWVRMQFIRLVALSCQDKVHGKPIVVIPSPFAGNISIQSLNLMPQLTLTKLTVFSSIILPLLITSNYSRISPQLAFRMALYWLFENSVFFLSAAPTQSVLSNWLTSKISDGSVFLFQEKHTKLPVFEFTPSTSVLLVSMPTFLG